MTSEESATNDAQEAGFEWGGFLESHPPGQMRLVRNLVMPTRINRHDNSARSLREPDLQLHCSSDTCGDSRVFHSVNSTASWISSDAASNFFLTYQCRNCQSYEKLYAVRALRAGDEDNPEGSGYALKLGELPSFGPPVPNRVLSLFGPDRELFLHGRQVENQGLGIGAYAYYRQVVSNHKQRLFDEIADVAEQTGASEQTIAQIREAADDWRFGRSIDDLAEAIPERLYVEGHNPLVLLHNALSTGLHEGSDEECLELAKAIRLVLMELTARMDAILDEKKELKNAVSQLMNDDLVTGDNGEN